MFASLASFAVERGVLTAVSMEAMVKAPDGGVASLLPVCAAAGNQRLARGAGGPDGGSLVVWVDDRNAGADAYAARIAADGTSLDATGFLVTPGGSMLDPTPAWDGEAYAVSWASYTDLFVHRVRGATSGPPVKVFEGNVDRHALVSLPPGVLAVWADSDARRLTARYLTPEGDHYDGGAPIDITDGGIVEYAPAIAAAPGRVLFAYTAADGIEPATGVRTRLFTLDGHGAPCAEAWTCLAGVCLDGGCVGGDAGVGEEPDAGVDGGPDGGTSPAGRAFRVTCACDSAGVVPLLLATLVVVAGRRRSTARKSVTAEPTT
jgi:hypothetical protein